MFSLEEEVGFQNQPLGLGEFGCLPFYKEVILPEFQRQPKIEQTTWSGYTPPLLSVRYWVRWRLEGHPERRHHRNKRLGGCKPRASVTEWGWRKTWEMRREYGQHRVCLVNQAKFTFYSVWNGSRGRFLNSEELDVVKVFRITFDRLKKKKNQRTRRYVTMRGSQTSVRTKVTRGICEKCKFLVLTTPRIGIL